MGRYFGTDGIRGPAGGPLIREPFFHKIGAAAEAWIRERGMVKPESRIAGKVVIGRDPRPSGLALARAVASGFGESCQCLDAGILPTPALSRLVSRENACMGIMITASHNPASDNGIKLFDSGGRKLDIREEEHIESLILGMESENPGTSTPEGRELPKIDGVKAYIESVQKLFGKCSLQGWKIVLDTANGATLRSSPALLRNLGAELIQLGDSPAGEEINRDCGSEHPQVLASAVKAHGAQLGFAHDGDGDRLLCVDETGEIVDGDKLMGLIALDGLKQGWLKGGKVVTTLQSNLGLDRIIQKHGGEVFRVPIGDRWVSAKMLETGASFGGENSGHFIFGDFGATGDGLVAAMMIAEILSREDESLSALAARIPLYPQFTGSLAIRQKLPLGACREIRKTCRALESQLGDKGRILVRYSGTEPKIRMLAEAEDVEHARKAFDALESAVQKDLVEAV